MDEFGVVDVQELFKAPSKYQRKFAPNLVCYLIWAYSVILCTRKGFFKRSREFMTKLKKVNLKTCLMDFLLFDSGAEW